MYASFCPKQKRFFQAGRLDNFQWAKWETFLTRFDSGRYGGLTIPFILVYSRGVRNMPATSAKNTEPRDLFPGALEMMILRSVQQQPMHGYALVQHIKQRS